MFVTQSIFNSVKKDLKKGLVYEDVKRNNGVSKETIRLIKKCPDWGQWEQDKINRHVQRVNKKYAKTLKGRISLFFRGIKV